MDDTSFIPKELKEKDVYGILGLTESEVIKENVEHRIRKQYLKKALHLHPDKKDAVVQNGTTETVNNKKKENGSSNDDFNLLKCAYDFLMSPVLRTKYNEYIKEIRRKKERKEKLVKQNRLYTDKRIFEERKWKEIYKRRLEEREQNVGNKRERLEKFEKKKEKEPTQEEIINKIKEENEEFMKKYHKSKHKKSPIKIDHRKNDKIHKDEEKKKMITIYLDDYKNNIELLDTYIKEKTISEFFHAYGFIHYDLCFDKNIERENGEEILKRVGHIIFESRTEAIKAYTYYKLNEKLINEKFKLVLEVPCKEKIEFLLNFYSNSSKEPSNMEGDEMDQMEQEVERLCAL